MLLMLTVGITGMNGYAAGIYVPHMVVKDDPANGGIAYAPAILEGSLKLTSGIPAPGQVIGKCGITTANPYFAQPLKTFLVTNDKGTNPVKVELRNNGEIVYRSGLFNEQSGATIFLDGINFFLENV
jgi:hypothetical protein